MMASSMMASSTSTTLGPPIDLSEVETKTETNTSTCARIATSPRLYLKGIHLPQELDNAGSTNPGRKQLFQQAVKELFSVHGQVVAVFVRDIFADYAFVAMATTKQAQCVLNHADASIGTGTLFEEIHPAADFLPKLPSHHDHDNDQPPLTKMESQHLQSMETLRQLSHSANLIVQCNKSHMERVQDVLSHQPGLQIRGATNYKIVSLIFCHCTQPHDVVQWLDSTWYIQPIIQRVFLGRPTPMSHGNGHDSDMDMNMSLPLLCQSIDVPDTSVLQKALQVLGDMVTQRIRIRLCTYPPILQSQLAPILKTTSIPWNPQSPTHILNVVQLAPPTWQQEGLYWIGVGDHYQPSMEAKGTNTSTGGTNSHGKPFPTTPPPVDSCSRAYFKLQEALERYFGTEASSSSSTNSTNPHHRPQWTSAIDVGASPGGWTQFLLDQCHCHHVYCIDPGKIDARVSESCNPNQQQEPQKSIDHIATKYQDGLPELAKRRRTIDANSNQHCQAVDCYVSDMCVKTMSEQIDALLLAVDLGLVQPSTTFVILTIKCTRGHSKATFDTLVANQVNRIQNHIHQLQILHLFANRYSERTVMGFWK